MASTFGRGDVIGYGFVPFGVGWIYIAIINANIGNWFYFGWNYVFLDWIASNLFAGRFAPKVVDFSKVTAA
jgi:hypothetical protein